MFHRVTLPLRTLADNNLLSSTETYNITLLLLLWHLPTSSRNIGHESNLNKNHKDCFLVFHNSGLYEIIPLPLVSQAPYYFDYVSWQERLPENPHLYCHEIKM